MVGISFFPCYCPIYLFLFLFIFPLGWILRVILGYFGKLKSKDNFFFKTAIFYTSPDKIAAILVTAF